MCSKRVYRIPALTCLWSRIPEYFAWWVFFFFLWRPRPEQSLEIFYVLYKPKLSHIFVLELENFADSSDRYETSAENRRPRLRRDMLSLQKKNNKCKYGMFRKVAIISMAKAWYYICVWSLQRQSVTLVYNYKDSKPLNVSTMRYLPNKTSPHRSRPISNVFLEPTTM